LTVKHHHHQQQPTPVKFPEAETQLDETGNMDQQMRYVNCKIDPVDI